MLKFLIIIGIGLGIVFVVKYLSGTDKKQKPDLSVYERRPFLFDAVSELNFYKLLMELYGSEYRIFTQVHYSHLIEPKKNFSWEEQRKYRSRIDRKSADFVICDKERVVPLLVIELDGSVHNLQSKKTNDEFKNDITNITNLPLLRISTNNLTRDFVKEEINRKLGT